MLSRRNVADALANTIKTLESHYEPTLNPILPFIIRLDGVAFRKYTASMQKPFDSHFTLAMIGTAFGLLERTSARMAFVQSDEITLAFSGDTQNKPLLYNGRVQKIASIIAAHASILFNSCMERGKQDKHTAIFDARTFSCPDEKTAMQAMYWRHAYDCRRNAINMIAHHKLPDINLKSVGQGEVMKLLTEQGISLQSFDPSDIYGTFVKKVSVHHMGFNPKTGEHVSTMRSRLQGRVFDWRDEDEGGRTGLVMSKTWLKEDTRDCLKVINEEDLE
jgi:tRNA(His) guanylyltransferase